MSILWLILGFFHVIPADWPGYAFWAIFALLYIGDKDFSVKTK